MSKQPLYLRSSPATGTGSYGAVPVHNRDSSSEDEDYKRKEETLTESQILSRKRTSSAEQTRHRRRSGNATEVSLGPDGKTTIANAGEIAGQEPLSSGESSTSDHGGGERVDQASDPSVENSAYPEVRASVPNTDNIALSINTPRMWILSIVFAIIGSATNLFFSLRYPSVTISAVIALILVHPLGRLWDLALKRSDDPEEHFIAGTRQADNLDTKASRLTKVRRYFGQGRWNEKEHACVYIASNVSFGFAFATDVIAEQFKFYNQETPIMYQILLTISTQILGYAFAGLTRRFLVRPAAMIWPGTLMSTAMFTTMHKNENKPANGWIISRYRFFCYIWAGSVVWYFFPGVIAPVLSHFNVITWAAPQNVVVANLFGVSSGLGMFPMTFDWSQIAYVGSPLLTPWWAAANVLSGLAIVMWIIAPILYYTNTFFSAYMPILSSSIYDDKAQVYDVQKILTPDYTFDKDAYERYSKVYMPITYALSYAVQFAALAALITHTVCWHGKSIWRQTKAAFNEQTQKNSKNGYEALSQPDDTEDVDDAIGSVTAGSNDIHARLMQRYQDVPMWWYLVVFIAMLGLGMFVVEYYPTHLPWYGLLLAIGITCVFFLPVAIVMAITNQHSSLYLVSQLVCGVVFPGRPVANMVFVTYAYISSSQGVKFSSDLKLGHYMKIPPKTLFHVQMIATLVASLVQIGVLNWMFAYIPGICTSSAIDGFTCPYAKVHFNGSLMWGLIGPARFFGPGALYRHLVWAFLIGAVTPIGVWYMGRNRKRSIWRKINLPVVFGSLSWIPPATGLNFSIWGVVCFLFNHVLRRRAPQWWGKYTMTMSAALDSGLAFGLVVVFFSITYPGFTKNFHWWGTEIYQKGCDWLACPLIGLAPGEKFGTA